MSDDDDTQQLIPQRWRCQWCGHPSPVPSMNADHEEKCPARPEGEA